MAGGIRPPLNHDLVAARIQALSSALPTDLKLSGSPGIRQNNKGVCSVISKERTASAKNPLPSSPKRYQGTFAKGDH